MVDAGRVRPGLPASLVLGLVLTAVQTAAIRYVFVTRDLPPSWVWLVDFGVTIAAGTLCALGASELAQRNTGAARRGLQLASAGWLLGVALDLAWRVMTTLALIPDARLEPWRIAFGYGWCLAAWLPPVGLVIATRGGRRAVAAVCLGLVVVSVRPPFAWRWLALGRVGSEVFHGACATAVLALIAGLAATLAWAPVVVEPSRGAAGLRRVAAALRLRVIAELAGVVAALLEIAHPYSAAALMVRKLCWIGGTAVSTIALVWLSRGLLEAARGAQSLRGTLVTAGATLLWCGAVSLAIAVNLYGALYGTGTSFQWKDAEALLALPLPLVAAVGLVMVVLAAAGLATPRPVLDPHPQDVPPHEQVTSGFTRFAARFERERSSRAAGGPLWIVGLIFASLAIQHYLASEHSSNAARDLAVLAGSTCTVVALLLLAALCRRAAAAVDGGQSGLPQARVVTEAR
jgi:hypothetical protein